MSLVLKDRVRETTTVLGTSDATLLGAVTGFQAFSVVGNGNTCYYTISDQSGGNWEVGIGTYSTVGPTLARTTILASSNSGSIVSFPAGTKDVFLTLPAEVAVVSSNNPSTAGYVLSSNGTGVAPSWVAGTSITVGAAGSNTQVQYNNSGVLGASSNFTFDGTNIGLAGGTANGVAYLNGSKVLTTGSALTFDGTNLGVGGSPVYARVDAITGTYGAFCARAATTGTNQDVTALASLNNDSSYYANAIYKANSHVWYQGYSTEQMRLTSTGLGIGTSSPSYKLNVVSSGNGTNSRFTNGSSIVDIYNGSGTSYIGDAGVNNSIGFTTSNSSITFYTSSGTERMRLDSSGNLGLGVTPSAWASGDKAFQLAGGAVFAGGTNVGSIVGKNMYFDGTSYKYISNGYANMIQFADGAYLFRQATSGTAGAAITFTQAMTLDASGNLGIGTSSPSYKLDVKASSGFNVARFSGQSTSISTYIYADTAYWAFGDTASYGGNLWGGHAANNQLFAYTAGTERMRIDSSGNVGIGTSSPASKLSVYGTSGNSAISFINSAGNPCSYIGSTAANNYITGALANETFIRSDGVGIAFSANTGSSVQMRLDTSGNLGLGVTPSAWSALKAFQINAQSSLSADGTSTQLSTNAYYGSGGWTYIGNNYATNYYQTGGQHVWRTAPSGTAGNAITFTQAMTLDASGNLSMTPASGTACSFNVYSNGQSSNPVTLAQGYSSVSDNIGYLYNRANAAFVFGTNNTERMRIDSSGNVIVGGTSAVTIGGTPSLTIGNGSNSPSFAFYGASAGQAGQISFGDAASGTGSYEGYLLYSNASDYMAFGTSHTERMRIDSSGNVGIGTSSPNSILTFAGNITSKNNDDYGIGTNGGNNHFNVFATGASGAVRFFTGGSSATAAGGGGTERMRIKADGGIMSQPTGGGTLLEQFGCRAWVNFNGQGTVAIRASGNVSSITDNGTGDYTVNFSTSMPDANYASGGAANWNGAFNNCLVLSAVNTQTTSASRFNVNRSSNEAATDPIGCYVQFFR